MPQTRKPLSAQTLVITGATSGIGLATARAAGARGANLILVARDEPALHALAEELRATGSRADYVVADVATQPQVQAIAAAADRSFGGVATWINNAGVSIYGRIEDTPIADQKRLFETNYWGLVYGSLAAVAHLKAREGGGTLINVGSVLSDQAVPLQGVYSASKHAVKGFTNALRMELLTDAPQVSVTLIKPSAIDTPYREHAPNYTGAPVKNPPPVYAAPLVAEAILHAADTPTREITVGGGGRLLAVFAQLVPALAEPMYAWSIPWLTKAHHHDDASIKDGLHQPGGALKEHSPYFGVRQTSVYTQAQMNPRITAGVLAGVGTTALLYLAAKDRLRVHRIRQAVRDKYRQ